MKPIPFDSFTLSAVVHECQDLVGGRVQDVRQPNPTDLFLGVYSRGREYYLLLSCHKQFGRALLTTRRPRNAPEMPAFCGAIRSRIEGASVRAVRQVGRDRVMELDFEGNAGEFTLVLEATGRHANLILRQGKGVVAAAEVVGRGKSVRPVVPGQPYLPPPNSSEGDLLEAKPGDVLEGLAGASPFLVRTWLPAMGPSGLDQVQRAWREGRYTPVLVPGCGAYPLPVAALGYEEVGRESISVALEQHHAQAIPAHEATQLQHSLLAQLRRVRLARETALADLRQAEAAGVGAPREQLFGELLLALGPNLPPGQSLLSAEDYEGRPIEVLLDPELDYRANAERYFVRARKAKSRLGLVREQIERFGEEVAALDSLIGRVEVESRLDRMQDLKAEAESRRWLNRPNLAGLKREERPFAGHRVRELVGPGGIAVLYGENAEANDYLTLRVARPNDYWLHVRGHTSAHVVIATQGKPDRVTREMLLFAARVAVQQSNLKHSRHVPVDYTLKKYVRRRKGAPLGSAEYTHEKTLDVVEP